MLSGRSRLELAAGWAPDSPMDPQDTIKTLPLVHDLAGKTVGRFTLRERLGAGGMGQVFRAEDTTLKRVVAIKRMAPQLQADEQDRQRFLKEAQRASALNHPNLAAIYDVLEDKGEIFLVMEYVEGKTLRLRMKEPIPIEEFLEIAIQCGEGLGAAHDQRIVHGDIKPENIMLTPGQRVKILDFGVARRFTVAGANEATESLASMTASLGGTPAYMAPEVLMQKPYDGRADIFSLGLVFYEMLGGQQPFQTESFAATVGRVLHTEAPPLSQVNRKVPAPVAGMVNKMLAKEAAARYPSAQVLVADLRAVQRGSQPSLPLLAPSGLPPARSETKAVPWLPARWVLLLAGTALLGLLVALPAVRHPLRGWLVPSGSGQASPRISGLPQNKYLAVLPFQAAEGNPKLTAFGNGFVETLTAKLTQLGENHALQVISAGEIRAKKVATLEQARQVFGVNLALQVSLRQSGDLVRATYTLTDPKTGRTLAASTFDAPTTDPFSLEDRVANGVASALAVDLRPEERRGLVSHGTTIAEAYNYYLQGRGYLDDPVKPENISSAIILFSQALKLDPHYGFARAGLGMAYWWKYYSTKDKKAVLSAREACSKAVDDGNAGAEGHTCLGLVYNGRGQYQQAALEFQTAINLEPTSDEAYNGLAKAYEHLNKLDEAEKTYQRVVALRPQYPRAYLNLGAFYLQQAQAAKAIEMFTRAVDLAPDSYVGYSNLGAALLYQARYAEALKPLEQSLAIRPAFGGYTNLGTAYLRVRRFADAVRAYREATKLDATQYAAWGSLGDAYYWSGDPAQAKGAYQKAVELAKNQLEVNPNDAEVLGDVADYYAMQGDRKQALAALNQSLQIGHGDKDLLFNAAVVYQELGDTGIALEWLKKSLDAGFSAESVGESMSFQSLKDDPRFQRMLPGKTN